MLRIWLLYLRKKWKQLLVEHLQFRSSHSSPFLGLLHACGKVQQSKIFLNNLSSHILNLQDQEWHKDCFIYSYLVVYFTSIICTSYYSVTQSTCNLLNLGQVKLSNVPYVNLAPPSIKWNALYLRSLSCAGLSWPSSWYIIYHAIQSQNFNIKTNQNIKQWKLYHWNVFTGC